MTRVLRVAVVGAGGRFGRAACAAIERDARFELVGRFGRGDDWPSRVRELRTDVALEATCAGRGLAHGLALLEAGAHVVVATSGVGVEDEAALDRRARELGLGGLVVPNFSLGALLMLRACAEFAAHFPAVEIVELHHAAKRDAPSGTALETARRVRAARGEAHGDVPIHSVRLPGLHAHQTVLFGAPGEVLSLRHDVSSPEAYGPGVVAALAAAAARTGFARGIEHAFDLPR